MLKKIVVADHSGSNTDFLGVFTKDSIDTVFNFIKWGTRAGNVQCDLYNMGGRGLKKVGTQTLQKSSDVNDMKESLVEEQADEIMCHVITTRKLESGSIEEEKTRIDITRGMRRRFMASFCGSHVGLDKIMKASQFGLESEQDESSGNILQHFRIWINGKSERYSSGMKNRIKDALNWNEWGKKTPRWARGLKREK